MKKISLFLFLVTISVLIHAQTLDDVLKQVYDAGGNAKMADLTSVKITGKIVQSGIEIPFIQYQMRPAYIRNEGTFQGQTFIQAFNGDSGWTINPFTGSLDPQPLSEDELKNMRIQADMDGMLWKWKEKGYTVTLEGNEDVEGTPCYKIKIIMPDGDMYTDYIDTDSYMLIRQSSKEKIQGVDVESDTYFSNFKQVNGIAFPGKIEQRFNGVTQVTIVCENFELNAPMEKTLFDNPKKG